MVTRQSSGDVWSYPNVHGDIVATATGVNAPTPGTKIGPTLSYDPFGQALGPQPNNAPSRLDFGCLGQPQRPTEHAGTTTVVEMGADTARAAGLPAVGRALASFKSYYVACGTGASAGAYAGTAASVATSGGLDSPLLVPATTLLGCVTAVQYVVLVDRLA